MGKAAMLLGGILKGTLDPSKHTDAKSLEVNITSSKY